MMLAWLWARRRVLFTLRRRLTAVWCSCRALKDYQVTQEEKGLLKKATTSVAPLQRRHIIKHSKTRSKCIRAFHGDTPMARAGHTMM